MRSNQSTRFPARRAGSGLLATRLGGALFSWLPLVLLLAVFSKPAAAGWSPLGPGTDGPIYALAWDGVNNYLYAGGDFTAAGGVPADRIARWDGQTWSALGSGVNGICYALTVDEAGNLYAGGLFTTAGGGLVNHIARWDGQNWHALAGLWGGVNNGVMALAAGIGGNIYAGGHFTTTGGGPADRIARWDGTSWHALGSGVSGAPGGNDAVLALTARVFPPGQSPDGWGYVYAGGNFASAGGVTAGNVARWDSQTWSALGTGVSDSILALAVDGAWGDLYAGGWFTTAWGGPGNYIAGWDGSSWSALNSGVDSAVLALACDNASHLYAGGFFTTAGGGPANHIARWDGSSWNPLDSGMSGYVYALACDSAGGLYAGGSFTTAGGVAANRVARWEDSPPPLAGSDWTWMKGADFINQTGVYGTIGVAWGRNRPGAREFSVSWTYPAGHLWLFGGWGLAQDAGSEGPLNDLWRYDPAAGHWTWVTGADFVNQTGAYGTMGVGHPENTPGARAGAVSWTDPSGGLWLFGGRGLDGYGGSGYLNDLWRYQPVTPQIGQWTWMTGADIKDQPGVYGTLSVPAAGNTPGAREFAVSWTDPAGNLWLFGGRGLDRNAKEGFLNDLWRYHRSTDMWAWMKGADFVNQTGVYGTRGVAHINNRPGARMGAVTWIDQSDDLWLFGGRGYDDSGLFGYLNDLWRYQPATGYWTWMTGADFIDQPGTYGSWGVLSAVNTPGARAEAVSWIDPGGDFWLFGGWGYDQNADWGPLNDLWLYRPAAGQWTWMTGADFVYQTGVYGTMGVGHSENTPGARQRSVSWADQTGGLWLFGGRGEDGAGQEDLLNDLWLYGPVTLPVPPPVPTPSPTLSPAPPVPTYTPFLPDPEPSISPEPPQHLLTPTPTPWLPDPEPSISPEPPQPLVTPTPTPTPTPAGGSSWVWMKGANTVNQEGYYGILGLPHVKNHPGARNYAVSWTDPAGDFWLFGGLGLDQNGTLGSLNDLWRYQPATGNWAWMKGDDLVNQAGIYGSLGVPAAANKPGGRGRAVSWTDPAGDFWLFGGLGYDQNDDWGRLNDLWRYQPATGNWTWMKGSNLVDQMGTYGSQEMEAAANTPGVREFAVSWTDPAGNLWLFGGVGYDRTGDSGRLNDLWRYRPATGRWAWMKGDDLVDQTGIYGSLGVPAAVNKPGARYAAVSWTDPAGDLWLWGGEGYDINNDLDCLNDLWRYRPADGRWTWIKGSDTVNQPGYYTGWGVSDPLNTPGARGWAVSWTDPTGDLWLFGGFSSSSGPLNDLWHYRPATGDWTWMTGADFAHQAGTYGTMFVAHPLNTPGARYRAVTWTDPAGALWLFGGGGLDQNGTWGLLNDLWLYGPTPSPTLTPTPTPTPWLPDPEPSISPEPPQHLLTPTPTPAGDSNWVWMKGANTVNQKGYYGILGLPHAKNRPGARTFAVSWTDPAGDFWLFGGHGLDQNGNGGSLNDLWRYQPTTGNWAWMKGDSFANQIGIYGSLGVPAAANKPSGRRYAVSWTDQSGDFWLFGGGGLDQNGNFGPLNDLWRYHPATGNWTWMKGSSVRNQPGYYTVWGVSNPLNTPGGRVGAVSWTDPAGDLWLFGGWGYDGYGQYDLLNDLWRYRPATGHWAWMKGDDFANQAGIYGSLGVPAAANKPGARYLAVSWTDPSGDLWLWGGEGYGDYSTGRLNDLWRYRPATGHWAWIKGAPTTNQPGYYTGWGVPDPLNTPGGRRYAVSWTDPVGDLWLFGGRDFQNGLFNDLWRYRPAAGDWTWMTGANFADQAGTYGTMFVAHPLNTPGARAHAVTWADPAGALWLFGGYGRDIAGNLGLFNDLWRYGPPPIPVPPWPWWWSAVDSVDYDGDGVSEIAIFRAASGLWAVQGLNRVYFGRPGDIPISGDYSGDGTAEIAVFRPETGLWAVRGLTRFRFGGPGDFPVPGDYRGEGAVSAAVFRAASGLWAVQDLTRVYFGRTGDLPVPGDYSGDEVKEIAVFRSATGLWAVRGAHRFYFGREGDIPVTGDFTGDGTAEAAVFRSASGLWAVRGARRFYFGREGDIPVTGDFTGDSLAKIGVFRPASGLWAVRGVTRLHFGGRGDFPATR